MIEKENVILGAGLVGTLLSVLLKKRGYTVDVFEKRSDLRRKMLTAGRSINLALSHRGFRALEEAGMKEVVLPLLVEMKGRMVHHLDSSTQFQPYSQEGNAIYSVSRNVLNKKLIEKAAEEGVSFHFDHYCEEINLEEHTLTFDHESDFVKINTKRVFGADGAYSILRKELGKQNYVSADQEYLDYGYKELNIEPIDGEFAMYPNALHIWPRKNFMLIALPNTDRTFTVTLFLSMKGKESFEQLENEQSREDFFQKHFPDALELIPDLHEQWEKYPTSSLVTIAAFPWTLNNTFMLIGDAAHAILPFYGQGMNAGFEDCRVLMELLDATKENWPETMEMFQHTRKKDADAIARLAYENFIEMRDKVSDQDFIERKKIENRIHEKFGNRWLPLYSMVSFSDIPYHEALIRGKIQENLIANLMQKNNSITNDLMEKVILAYEKEVQCQLANTT